jgi:hypothetical protein
MRNQSLLLLVLACVLAAHVTHASAAQSNEVQTCFVPAFLCSATITRPTDHRIMAHP